MAPDAEKAYPESSSPSTDHVDDGHHLGLKPVNETVGARNEKKEKDAAASGKRELKEEECEDELGYAFPEWKKWWILTVIFLVQTSMNFNTSLYSNGLQGISEKFGVSEQAARVGAAIFLILYAFGCELWAPWSEEFGRKPVLQASLFLVNIWTLPVALAPNFGCLLVGRALGGLSSAGGSVTLGMIADLFDSDSQQYAVAYIVFSSVGGSILGPIIGGFVQQFLPWQWTIWIQLIFGGFVQLLHLFTVPETRTTVMMDRIAKKRRKSGVDPNVYGPNEIEPFRERFTVKELMYTWLRPFRMFLTEPIVLTLSLLSGFSDALIFMQIQSFSLVYTQWGFNDWQTGLAFIPIGIGYLLAWLSFLPAIKRNIRARERNPEDEHAQYEDRLYWLLYTAPCLPIGLIIFAWTSSGPPLHWIGSMFGSAIIGIANFSIYMATIDYMICAYGPYSASATGGNGWSRDFLAGVLTVPATPFYTNIGASQGKNLQYASTILFCISFLLVMFVYYIYWKGPELRKKSPFAQTLASGGEGGLHRHPGGRRASLARVSSRQSTGTAGTAVAGTGAAGADVVRKQGNESQQASSLNDNSSWTATSSRAHSYDQQNHQQQQQPSSASRPTTAGADATCAGASASRGAHTPAATRPVMMGDRFGPGSRKSSYYSSRNAASRNASRRNSLEIRDDEDVKRDHHQHNHQHLQQQHRTTGGDGLAHLSTIQSVQQGN